VLKGWLKGHTFKMSRSDSSRVHGLSPVPRPHLTTSESSRSRKPGGFGRPLTLKSPFESTPTSQHNETQEQHLTKLTVPPNTAHQTRQTPQCDLVPDHIIRRIPPLQPGQLGDILGYRLIPILITELGQNSIHRDEFRNAVQAEHSIRAHFLRRRRVVRLIYQLLGCGRVHLDRVKSRVSSDPCFGNSALQSGVECIRSRGKCRSSDIGRVRVCWSQVRTVLCPCEARERRGNKAKTRLKTHL